MDPLAATIEIFVSSVSAAVFGGTALLIALEAKADHLALKNRMVVARTMASATADQIQLGTVQSSKAGNADNIAVKAA